MRKRGGEKQENAEDAKSESKPSTPAPESPSDVHFGDTVGVDLVDDEAKEQELVHNVGRCLVHWFVTVR